MDKNSRSLFIWVLIVVVTLFTVGYLYYQNIQFAEKNKQLIQLNQLSQQQKQTSGQIIANKARCQKDASEYYKEKQSKESVGPNGYGVLGNESYTYNLELNTCLLAWEDMLLLGNGTAAHVRHITDIYSNSDIYSWWERSTVNTGETETLLGSEAEYNQKLQSYGLY